MDLPFSLLFNQINRVEILLCKRLKLPLPLLPMKIIGYLEDSHGEGQHDHDGRENDNEGDNAPAPVLLPQSLNFADQGFAVIGHGCHPPLKLTWNEAARHSLGFLDCMS